RGYWQVPARAMARRTFPLCLSTPRDISRPDAQARMTSHEPRRRPDPVYKHILVATDGSELSERAIQHAVSLAQAVGAKVTALTVIKPWHTVAPGEIMVAFPESEYRKGAEIAAQRYVGYAKDAAAEKGVPCETRWLEQEHPW